MIGRSVGGYGQLVWCILCLYVYFVFVGGACPSSSTESAHKSQDINECTIDLDKNLSGSPHGLNNENENETCLCSLYQLQKKVNHSCQPTRRQKTSSAPNTISMKLGVGTSDKTSLFFHTTKYSFKQSSEFVFFSLTVKDNIQQHSNDIIY